MEEGRKALHALIGIGLGGWLFPGTDLIVSMAPFHNLPNQYRITIDGQQNGLPNELSNRQQFAGFSQVKQSILKRPASIVANRSAWISRTGKS